MKVRPLYDRLVIKRVEAEPETKGGILIPETAKETPQQGTVVAAGGGKVMEDGSVRALLVSAQDMMDLGILRQRIVEGQ